MTTNNSPELRSPRDPASGRFAEVLQWLQEQQGTAQYNLLLTLFVFSTVFGALALESAAAHAHQPSNPEQTTGTTPPVSEDFEYDESKRNVRGDLLQASFERQADGGYPNLELLYIGDQYKAPGLDLGIYFGDSYLVFRLEPEVYRAWLESDRDLADFIAQFPGTEPKVQMVLQKMIETTVINSKDKQRLTKAQVSFVVTYTFSQNRGLSSKSAQSTVTFVIEPDDEGMLLITDYGVTTVTPDTFAGQDEEADYTLAGPEISQLSAVDLAGFGKELQPQLAAVIENAVLVQVADHNVGLPPFATGSYAQLHPGEFDQAELTQITNQLTERVAGGRDLRFGAVKIAKDGTQLVVTDKLDAQPLLTAQLPDGFVMSPLTGQLPAVLAANPDGTLLAFSGMQLSKLGEPAALVDAETSQIVIFRWETAQGAEAFVEKMGLRVNQETLDLLQGPSIEAVTLRADEEVVGFNDGLFGVAITADGITVRQLAVSNGFDAVATKKQGLKTVVNGEYPVQPHTTQFGFETMQNSGVVLAEIVPESLKVVRVTARVAPGNLGPKRDTELTIEFTGTTGDAAQFTGSLEVIVSTGIDQTAVGGTDGSTQFSMAVNGTGKMNGK